MKSIRLNRWGAGRWASSSGSSSLGRAATISAEVASEGVILFLAYLALVNADEPPSMLLIEEPENGVHPRQLERIADTSRA